MPDDLDHEVIDSPQALFRHLYEAHGLVEALDLDPATAPLQFWLRRHAELERAASRGAAGRPTGGRLSGDPAAGRLAAAGSFPASGRRPVAGGEAAERRSAGRSPGASVAVPTTPPTTGRGGGAAVSMGPANPGGVTGAGSGPRFRRFADPLVEAVAAALVGRGLDERWVRRGLSTYTGTDGRHGEEAVRAAFVVPMLEAIAGQLAGGPPSRAQWPPATPRTAPREAAGQDPTRRAPAPRAPATREPARPESVPQERAGRSPAAQEPASRASRPRGAAAWEPAARAASSGQAEVPSGGRETWAPQPLAARAAGPDLNADFMAIADVLQERRRSRRGGSRDTPTPRVSTPPATTPTTPPPTTPPPTRSPVTAPPAPREPDDDVMALANALQRGRGNGRQ